MASRYVEVREQLLERVRDLAEGTRLPPEPTLCAEYGVSRITLRHAVDGLVSDGWLTRQHGRGTFVSSPRYRTTYRERFAGEVAGFHAQQSGLGFTVTSRVLTQAIGVAREPVASALELPVGELVIELERLRYVEGRLHHLVRTWLPAGRFPGLVDRRLDTDSLYAVLRSDYGCTLDRSDMVVSIDSADTRVAELLGVEVGEKLLNLASTIVDDDGARLVHGRSFFTPRNSEIVFGLGGR